MGDKRETVLFTSSCLTNTLGSTFDPLWLIGATALAIKPAPSPTKKEKKIQTAREARAEVAVLRKTTEKRIAIPSQKDT
jgi:hypothetical protein